MYTNQPLMINMHKNSQKKLNALSSKYEKRHVTYSSKKFLDKKHLKRLNINFP